MMKVLTWNCMGQGKSAAQAYCRKLMVTHNPAVVILLETQLSEKSLNKALAQIGRCWECYSMHAR